MSVPQREPSKGIVSPESLQAAKEAAEIRERARGEAKRIVEEASERADGIREKAEAAGFEAGLGRLAGKDREFSARFAERLGEERAEMTRLALEIARRVLSEEIKLHPDRIEAVVQEVLEWAQDSKRLRILIHPDDAGRCARLEEVVRGRLDADSTFRIVESDEVTPGGCEVVSELGRFRADLESQLRAIRTLLLDEPDE